MKLITLTGASACGKDSLLNKVLESNKNIKPIISVTTRPKREGEKDGVEYKFISLEELKELYNNEELIEIREYNTEHGVWYYGITKDSIDIDSDDNIWIGTDLGINKISKDYQIIVIEGYIIGFLKKDILYITPKVRYITDKNVDTSLILSLIESKKIKYPKLSDINLNNGDYYCFDLENELVSGVFIKNGNYYHLLLTETEKLNSDHYPIKYGSVSNYVHDLLKPKDVEVIDTDYLILKSYPLNFIFKQMFKKYCYDNPNNINKEDFMKYYSKILTKSPTNFKNINWRTFDLEETIINQDEFEKFISKYIINEELYYNIIQEDYNLDVFS